MEIEPGLYEHFKGGKAVVFGVAKHTEAHHMQFVFYMDVEGGEMWTRPIDNFTQRIQRDEYDGPRFWRIGTFDDAVTLLPDGTSLFAGGDTSVEDTDKQTADEKAEAAKAADAPARHDASTMGQRPS